MTVLALEACLLVWFSLWLPSAAYCARARVKGFVVHQLETMEDGGPVRLDDLVSVLWSGRGLEREGVMGALRTLEREGRARCQPWRDPNAGREHLMPYSPPAKGSDTWTYIRR